MPFGGGTLVTLKSPSDDYSIIIETKDASAPQQLRFRIGNGLSVRELCVWRSNGKEQFIRQPSIKPNDSSFAVTLEPDSVYSISTTTGQQKGSFDTIPADHAFPFPYHETFEEYSNPRQWGKLPHYFADIADAFEVVDRPDKQGKCIRQVIPVQTISWAPDWQPYTILGNDQWQDYEVSADACLNEGESAGIMGRINQVGTGYGFIPKGYFLQLASDGQCRLVVVRGKKDKKKAVGDAEQQALTKAGKDDSEGGEKVIGSVKVQSVAAGQWHNLELRFQGSTISGLIDGKVVLTATDSLYPQGMAGLMAGVSGRKLSMPYFDNLLINRIDASIPNPAIETAERTPIYTGITKAIR